MKRSFSQVVTLADQAYATVLANVDYRTFMVFRDQNPPDVSVLNDAHQTQISSLKVRGHYTGTFDQSMPFQRGSHTNPLAEFQLSRLEICDGTTVRIQVEHQHFPEFHLSVLLPADTNFEEDEKYQAFGRISPNPKPDLPLAKLGSNVVKNVFVRASDSETAVIRVDDYERDPAFWVEIVVNRKDFSEWLGYQ